jgi:dolichol kinase
VSRLSLGRELARKALHLLFAAVPIALAAGVSQTWLVSALGAMLALALAIELTRGRIAAVGSTFNRAVGPLLRHDEHVRWTGATWLILVCLVAVWLLTRPNAIAVTWAAAVGDASAALIGIPLGGRLIPKHARGKSVEGSAACFLVTFAGAHGLAGLSTPLSLVVAAAATAAEWPRSPIDDNVRVGAATTGVLIIAGMIVFAQHG